MVDSLLPTPERLARPGRLAGSCWTSTLDVVDSTSTVVLVSDDDMYYLAHLLDVSDFLSARSTRPPRSAPTSRGGQRGVASVEQGDPPQPGGTPRGGTRCVAAERTGRTDLIGGDAAAVTAAVRLAAIVSCAGAVPAA